MKRDDDDRTVLTTRTKFLLAGAVFALVSYAHGWAAVVASGGARVFCGIVSGVTLAAVIVCVIAAGES